MATNKSYFSRSKFRFLPSGDGIKSSDSVFELDESDLFNSSSSSSPTSKSPVSNSRFSKGKRRSSKVADSGDRKIETPASLPVNIPDWSKILRNEYRENRKAGFDEDEEEDQDDDDYEDGVSRVPPHEFLARTRIASFSVHEGIGRTLKGRDLSRVRNAIWEKIGFED